MTTEVPEVPMEGWPSVSLHGTDAGKILCVTRSKKDGGKVDSELTLIVTPQELETVCYEYGPIDLRPITQDDIDRHIRN